MKKDNNKGSYSTSPALEEMWKFSPSPPTQLNYMEVNDGQPTAEAKQRTGGTLEDGGWGGTTHPRGLEIAGECLHLPAGGEGPGQRRPQNLEFGVSGKMIIINCSWSTGIQHRKPGLLLPFVGDLGPGKEGSWGSSSSVVIKEGMGPENPNVLSVLPIMFLVQNKNCTG